VIPRNLFISSNNADAAPAAAASPSNTVRPRILQNNANKAPLKATGTDTKKPGDSA
jgi:hypothetical protein